MSIENPYSPPQTNLESSIPKRKVYSPNQSALGGFLGGVLAPIYFIRENFIALEDDEAVSQTTIYGGLFALIFFLITPFIPENFPNMVIPIATVICTRLFIERSQFTKEDIINDERLEFHSNWRVFFVGLISLLVSVVIIFVFVVLFSLAGIM